VGVQHHHAHIASCLAENGAKGPVIGLAMDGLGYGTDGTIWGGEFLYADFFGFERIATFKNIPMPGGAAAIKEPWRMAVSYLYDAYKEDLPGLDIPFMEGLGRSSLATLVKMIQLKLNSPLTSSLGRIFDAVSAILQIRSEVRYEGQAAFELEMAIDLSKADMPPYSYFIVETDKSLKLDHMIQSSKREQDSENLLPYIIDFPTYIIDMKEAFKQIVGDVRKGTSAGEISARFHNTIISILLTFCSMMRMELELDQVALSGGVFQNKYLFEKLSRGLQEKGFDLLTHSEVPTNDGGLSLGQAVIAGSLLNKQRKEQI
jgi:hydrogenase maturation protein HypF